MRLNPEKKLLKVNNLYQQKTDYDVRYEIIRAHYKPTKKLY